jgi:hypothetical protein
MANKQRALLVCTAIAGVALGIAAPAGANPFRGFIPAPIRHGGRGRPNPVAHSQCLQNCGQLDSLCLSRARITAQGCSDSTCSTERQGVTEACTADHRSAACQSARSALHLCLQPCRDALNTAAATCRGDRQTCVATCATAVPSQPDPQCVVGCRTTLQTCRLDAGKSSQSCYTDCDAAITAAEAACAVPSSDACTTALQTAQACVRACGQGEQTALQVCLQTSQTCITGCPNATPTPAPGPTTSGAAALRLRPRRGH